jgi:hypothetical protein
MKMRFVLGFCSPAIFGLLLTEMNSSFLDATSYKWIAALFMILALAVFIIKFSFTKTTVQNKGSVFKTEPFPFKAKVFCLADKTEECVAGTIESMMPFNEGQTHQVKDKKWIITNVGENCFGDTMVDMKPA